jgi:cysteine desulfurase
MQRIYFDNSATTQVDRRVMDAMLPYHLEKYGNASSLHSFGREAYKAMEEARGKVAKAIGAQGRDIIFTSGGTESDNLAIQGAAYANMEKGKHIITSVLEHPAVLNTCHFLEGQGFTVSYIPVDRDGIVRLDELKKAIGKDTTLVTIMAANNEIGTIQPFREIGAIAHEAGALFHTDAVQAVAKVSIDVTKDNIDLMAMSAHKFHGPKGVGALFIKKGTRVRPVVYGGGHERGYRSSTENIPGIVGMGKAIELAMEGMEQNVAQMAHIRDRIIDGVLPRVRDSGLNGHRTHRLCNNAHFRFDFIEGESLILQLDMKGIAASTGSACSSKSLEPSHVLLALGMRHEQAHGSLRVSLSRFNTMAEADYLVDVLPDIVENLRKMSPIKSWEDYKGEGLKEEGEHHHEEGEEACLTAKK